MQLDTAFAAALSRCDDDRRLRVLVRANEVDRFRAIELQCDRNGLTDRKLHENLSRRDRKAALAVGIVASPNREDDLLSLVGMDLPRREAVRNDEHLNLPWGAERQDPARLRGRRWALVVLVPRRHPAATSVRLLCSGKRGSREGDCDGEQARGGF